MAKGRTAPSKTTAAAPAAAQVPVAAEDPVLSVFSRPTDLILSGVYLFFAGTALFSFYAGCKGQGAKLPSCATHICSRLQGIDLALPMSLYKQWYSSVYTVEHDVFMSYAYTLVNVLLALPLSFVMLTGAKGNNWQRPAIVHASMLLLINAYTFCSASHIPTTPRNVFDFCYGFMVVAPVWLLIRWWKDNTFTQSRNRCGVMCGICSFFVHLVGLLALAYTCVVFYEWVITHKDFSGYQPVSPLFKEYTDVAAKHFAEFSQQAGVHLEDLGKTVTEQIQQMTGGKK